MRALKMIAGWGALAAIGLSASSARADDASSFADEEPTVVWPPDRSARFVGTVRAAAAVHAIFDTPFAGTEVDVAFAWRFPRHAFLFGKTFRYGLAVTDGGLTVHRPTSGWLFGWQLDQVLVGFEPTFNALIVEQATEDDILLGLGGGVDLVFGYDLYRDDNGTALFLGARSGLHYIPEAVLLGGSLGLGVRFGRGAQPDGGESAIAR